MIDINTKRLHDKINLLTAANDQQVKIIERQRLTISEHARKIEILKGDRA
jgi:hypothetical protein